MANTIGRALEEVARSSASVAHFYRQISLGEQPGQFNVITDGHNRDFLPILQAAGTLSRAQPQASQPQVQTQIIMQFDRNQNP